MSRPLASGASLVLLVLPPLYGQGPGIGTRVAVQGISASDRTVGVEHFRHPGSGWGIGATVDVHRGRLTLEAAGFVAWLESPADTAAGSALSWRQRQVDARLRYMVTRFAGVEVGVSRRFLQPDFDGDALGLVRVGAYVRSDLADMGHVWARVADLPYVRFSGGGNGGFAAETGAGLELGQAQWKVHVVVAYEYQRINRTLGAGLYLQTGQPLATTRSEVAIARFGVQWRP